MDLPDPLLEIEQEVDKKGQPRHYTVDGERFPSVTTILRVLDKPALVSWGWKLGLRGAFDVFDGPSPNPPNLAKLEHEIRERELAWWQVRDSAGDRGNRLHEGLEALIKHGEIPSLSAYPEEERGFLIGLAKWWTNDIVGEHRVVASEVKVGSSVHGFAGRLDLVIEDAHDWLGLVDIKTGKKNEKGEIRDPYLEHHFQVGGGYRLGFHETYGVQTNAGILVQIAEDGDYQVTHAEAEPRDFLTVLDVYNSVARVKNRIKEVKKDG